MDDGTRYDIRPTIEPLGTFPSVRNEEFGRDDHRLETYNRVAARLAEDSRDHSTHGGQEFWRVIRSARGNE